MNKQSEGDLRLGWLEKYRPQDLTTDFVGVEELISYLSEIKTLGFHRLQNLMIFGPPGCGKTSLAILVAKMLYGPEWSTNVLDLNASDQGGIDVIRDQIQQFVQIQGGFFEEEIDTAPFRLVILDEFDMMSRQAQDALKPIMEKSSARFICLGNSQTRIIEPLRSRCFCIRFHKLPTEKAVQRLAYICQQEGIEASETTLEKVVQLTDGDMRLAIQTLQRTDNLKLTEEKVYEILNIPDPEQIKQILYLLLVEEGTYTQIYQKVLNFYEIKHLNLVSLCKTLLDFLVKSGKVNNDKLSQLAISFSEIISTYNKTGQHVYQLFHFVSSLYKLR